MNIRASSLDRVFSCPGSLTASALVPKPPDTAESTEGTVIHHLTAAKLIEEMGAVPPDGGLPPLKLPDGYQIPAFSAWIPEWAVRLVRDEVPADWSLMVEPEFEEEYRLPRGVWIEATDPVPEGAITRFTDDGRLEMLVVRVGLTGHLDVLAISPDGTEARGFDWKTGTIGADPAESNWQAAAYLGLIKKAWPSLKKAKFTLAQPKIDEDATGIPRVSHVELEGDKLDANNAVLAEHICRALENRYETDSSPKACKYCPVAIMRPWACPSLKLELETVKAKLTPEALAALKEQPNDATLGDFVAAGRTLSKPIEEATELLKERIRANGYLDSGAGIRFTIKKTKGIYKVTDPETFFARAEEDLGRTRMPVVFSPSMTALKDQIAEAKELPKTSKNGPSAASVFDDRYRPLTIQEDREILVLSQ